MSTFPAEDLTLRERVLLSMSDDTDRTYSILRGGFKDAMNNRDEVWPDSPNIDLTLFYSHIINRNKIKDETIEPPY